MTTQLQLNTWNLALRVHPATVLGLAIVMLTVALAVALAQPPTVIADPVTRSVV